MHWWGVNGRPSERPFGVFPFSFVAALSFDTKNIEDAPPPKKRAFLSGLDTTVHLFQEKPTGKV